MGPSGMEVLVGWLSFFEVRDLVGWRQIFKKMPDHLGVWPSRSNSCCLHGPIFMCASSSALANSLRMTGEVINFSSEFPSCCKNVYSCTHSIARSLIFTVSVVEFATSVQKILHIKSPMSSYKMEHTWAACSERPRGAPHSCCLHLAPLEPCSGLQPVWWGMLHGVWVPSLSTAPGSSHIPAGDGLVPLI